jgi:RNA polymerase sigma factor (sigma-70 family)
MQSPLDIQTVVTGAAAGDEDAWRELVARFAPLLARIARGFRLSPADAEDVAQATWLRLHEHIGGLREPAALPGWLSTTARREALRALQGPVREVLVDDVVCEEREPSAETVVLEAEQRRTISRAVDRLKPRQRDLVRLLLQDPPPPYSDIAASLGIPVGSIGPTWIRSAERLSVDAEVVLLSAER